MAVDELGEEGALCGLEDLLAEEAVGIDLVLEESLVREGQSIQAAVRRVEDLVQAQKLLEVGRNLDQIGCEEAVVDNSHRSQVGDSLEEERATRHGLTQQHLGLA